MDADVGFGAFERLDFHPQHAHGVVRAGWQEVLLLAFAAFFEHEIIPQKGGVGHQAADFPVSAADVLRLAADSDRKAGDETAFYGNDIAALLPARLLPAFKMIMGLDRANALAALINLRASVSDSIYISMHEVSWSIPK